MGHAAQLIPQNSTHSSNPASKFELGFKVNFFAIAQVDQHTGSPVECKFPIGQTCGSRQDRRPAGPEGFPPYSARSYSWDSSSEVLLFQRITGPTRRLDLFYEWQEILSSFQVDTTDVLCSNLPPSHARRRGATLVEVCVGSRQSRPSRLAPFSFC